MNYFIGIDPGFGGAVAIISGNKSGKVQLIDTPIIVTKKRNKQVREYNISQMASLLRDVSCKNSYALLEFVHSMPNQGVSSTFAFGVGFGIWQGVLGTLNIPYELISPSTWKKGYGERLIISKPDISKLKDFEASLPKKLNAEQNKKLKELKAEISKEKSNAKKEAKRAARALASEIFPEVADQLTREKDDGRAEALLMAEYKRRLYIDGK